MTPKIVTLQDLVQWSLLGALVLIILLMIFRQLERRKRKIERRQLRRRCAQCGLLQEIEQADPKFGTCSQCGGVTTRGRSRKLG